MKNEKPALNKSSFTCPHCQAFSLMTFKDCTFEEDFEWTEDDDDIAMLTGRPGHYKSTMHIARCHSCGKKIIWIDDEYIYPDRQPQEPNADMPKDVLKLYKEAGLIYYKSPRAACALLRLAIDKLCNILVGENEKNKKLDEKIGWLVKHGLSQVVQEALDSVRVIGNKAVHPGEIMAVDIDNTDTADKLFKSINFIVDKLISEPKEINDFYHSIPQSAKEAVKKRDNK